MGRGLAGLLPSVRSWIIVVKVRLTPINVERVSQPGRRATWGGRLVQRR